jgi:hypothetical protein
MKSIRDATKAKELRPAFIRTLTRTRHRLNKNVRKNGTPWHI